MEQPELKKLAVQAILSARDAASVASAEAVLDEWLGLYPEDDEMRLYASGLQRMKDAIRLTEAGLGNETSPAKRVLA